MKIRFFILIFILIISIYYYINNHARHLFGIRYSPPDFPITIEEFHNHFQSSHKWSFNTKGKTEYFEAIREISTPRLLLNFILTLYISPPAYIFDRQGYLIDWSLNRDDDYVYERRWVHGEIERQTITYEEVLNMQK